MKQLPKSYKEVNFKDYVKIIQSIPSERPDGFDDADWSRLVHFTYLSIFLGVEFEYLDSLKAKEIFELIKGLSFMDEPLEPTETHIHVKDINSLTYDEFANYQSLRGDQWNNLAEILETVTDLTPEEIDALSIHDVMGVFFCLKKRAMRYLTCLKYSTMLKIAIQKTKSLISSRR